jgi:hypothetical protein
MKRSLLLELIVIAVLAMAAFVGTKYDQPTQAQSDGTAVATDPFATETATEVATEPVSRVLIQVVSTTANFRYGPGRNYPVITFVKRGGKILLSGISDDGQWYMFLYAKQSTWISADPSITTVLEGDPKTLPVVEAPPVPTESAVIGSGDPDPRNCDFYGGMTPESQDAALQAVYGAVDANDWHQAGQLSRHLYACSASVTFYLLYNVYLPIHPDSPGWQTNIDTAFSEFYQGWIGQ